jgi:hypothetical protein
MEAHQQADPFVSIVGYFVGLFHEQRLASTACWCAHVEQISALEEIDRAECFVLSDISETLANPLDDSIELLGVIIGLFQHQHLGSELPLHYFSIHQVLLSGRLG